MTERIYASAPIEKKYCLRTGLEKKLNDVNSFSNSINNIKEAITYFKDKNQKPNKYKKFEMLTTLLKSFDTFVIIATTSSSIKISLTDVGKIATTISAATACGL